VWREPEIRLILGRQAAPEDQHRRSVKRKSQQPNHHLLVGFRRMAGNRQAVV